MTRLRLQCAEELGVAFDPAETEPLPEAVLQDTARSHTRYLRIFGLSARRLITD